MLSRIRDSNLNTTLIAVITLILITFLGLIFSQSLNLINIVLLYLIPIIIVSINGNMRYSLIVTSIEIILFDILFVPPLYSLKVEDIVHFWSFLIFFFVGYIVSWQSKMLITKTKMIDEREKRTRRLYELSYQIVALSDIDSLSKVTLPLISNSLECDVELYFYQDTNFVGELSYSKNLALFNKIDTKNLSFELSNEDFIIKNQTIYIPIRTHNRLWGVILSRESKEIESNEIEDFLLAVVRLLAVGIERISLEKENQKTKLLEHSNEVREILLNTLSHDLKTPLSSIIGSVGLLIERDNFDAITKESILKNIESSSKRMNRLIGNLLDSARLEGKNRNLKMDWCDIEDILGVALYEFDDIEVDKSISINLDRDLTLFWGDSVLLNRLVVNILDNAIKYSIQKEIVIDVIDNIDKLTIKISNDSKQIRDNELETIFDKFYRLDSYGDIKGSGIGLSICKSIVKAHNGEICAYNLKNGVCFEISLPKTKKPLELIE